MTTIINADTSGGLKLTSDTSGSLEIQSAGTTKLTIGSTSVDIPAIAGVTSINSGQVGGSRNKIINGAIEINQRGTAAVAIDQGFPSDRWKTAETGGGNMTCQVVADAPASFRNSIKVIASTADDCSQAADEYRIFQRIEGNNVVDLYYGASGAKTTTLSFWVKSSLTGNFPVGLENSASNRSLVKQYNIAQADTWEKKSVTFVGDETGTWLITNGIGLGVSFVLGAGSNYTNTIDAWQAARVYRGSSSVQMMATVNATWFVTGVQLEVGSTATDFEYRSFTDELALSQRYYWRATAGVTYALFASSTCEGTTSSVGGLVKHPVTMRASPTCTVGPALSNVRLYDGEGASAVTGYGGNWSTTDTWGQALAASGGGLTRGRGVMVQANNSTAAYIDATAEL
jgi:hypothetical protein